jgi:hypothetical protein
MNDKLIIDLCHFSMFHRYESERPPDCLKENAERAMEHLVGLAQRTSVSIFLWRQYVLSQIS